MDRRALTSISLHLLENEKEKKLWSKFCCLNARRSRRRDNWCRTTTTSHGARLVGHTVLLRIGTCVGEQTRLYCRGFLFFAHAVSIIRCLVRRELYNYNLFFHSSSIIRSGFASMTAQWFSCAVIFFFMGGRTDGVSRFWPWVCPPVMPRGPSPAGWARREDREDAPGSYVHILAFRFAFCVQMYFPIYA